MASSKKIKAVLFDLDGTLRLNLPSAGEVFIGCVRDAGMQISEGDRIRGEQWEYLYFASSLEVQEDTETYKNDLKAFWVNFTKRRLVSIGLDAEKAMQLASQVSDYMDGFYKPQVHVPEEIPSLLKHLHDSGYVLGVVSNREVPFQDELVNLKLDPYFHFSLAAGEVKSYKPDSLIFQHALKIAGTSAEETIYVGDNYFADIVGALRAGLTPVLYDPTGLFPEAADGCAVIRNYSEFYNVLN